MDRGGGGGGNGALEKHIVKGGVLWLGPLARAISPPSSGLAILNHLVCPLRLLPLPSASAFSLCIRVRFL